MSDNRRSWWFEDDDEDPEIVMAANILLDLSEGRNANDVRAAIQGSSDEDDEDSQQTSTAGSEDPGESTAGGATPPPAPSGSAQTTQTASQSNQQAPTNTSSTYNKSSKSSSTTPGSVLPQGDHWKFKQFTAAPLGYRTAADAEGGERILTYPYPIDFNNRESVNLANKTRAREVYRARKRFGLPLARESMAGREFTTMHFDWLSIAHEAYAMLHNGQLIPWNILFLWWNFCWRDGRSESSLRALYHRTQEFKDLRQGYER